MIFHRVHEKLVIQIFESKGIKTTVLVLGGLVVLNCDIENELFASSLFMQVLLIVGLYLMVTVELSSIVQFAYKKLSCFGL